MDKKTDTFQQIVNLEKKMKSWKKQNESWLDIVKELKQELQPRPSLPISVPFNIFQPKKITDKYTQTDLTIPEQLTVEEFEGGTRYSYILQKTSEENISKQFHNVALSNDDIALHRLEENCQCATPILDKNIEANISNQSEKDIYLDDNTRTTADKTTRITNEITKLANAIYLCDNKLTTDNEGSDIPKQTKITDDNQKTADKNDVTFKVDKTGDNDAMKDIFGSSENYKVFVNKIYTSIGKLFKSGIFSKNSKKLNNISILFDYIIVLCIEECECKKSNTEDYNIKDYNTNQFNNKNVNTENSNNSDLNTKVLNAKDCNTNDLNTTVINAKECSTVDLNTKVLNATDRKTIDSNTKDLNTKEYNANNSSNKNQVNNQETCTEVPSKKMKNITSEIELHLQTMKQERSDDEDTSELTDIIAADMDLVSENQIEILQREILNRGSQQPEQQQQQLIQQQQKIDEKQQQQAKQQKTQQPKSISYDPYLNLFMTQNPNSNNTMKDIRPPGPPTPAQTLTQTQTQTQTYSHNYYTNQEPVNKNYRHPFKRYNNNRPNTPYQRQQPMTKVPTPQSSHAQPGYTYPQYYQQNLQMQGHIPGMYPQNTPYH